MPEGSLVFCCPQKPLHRQLHPRPTAARPVFSRRFSPTSSPTKTVRALGRSAPPPAGLASRHRVGPSEAVPLAGPPRKPSPPPGKPEPVVQRRQHRITSSRRRSPSRQAKAATPCPRQRLSRNCTSRRFPSPRQRRRTCSSPASGPRRASLRTSMANSSGSSKASDSRARAPGARRTPSSRAIPSIQSVRSRPNRGRGRLSTRVIRSRSSPAGPSPGPVRTTAPGCRRPRGVPGGKHRRKVPAQILGPVHHHDATIVEESPGEVVRQKRHPSLPFPGGEDLRSRIGEPLQGLLQQAALAPRGGHQHHQVGH